MHEATFYWVDTDRLFDWQDEQIKTLRDVALNAADPIDDGLGFQTESNGDEKGQPFTGTIYELMDKYGFKNNSKFSMGINNLILIYLQARKYPSRETTHVVRRILGRIL